jgi:hypothetical protein
LQVTEQFGLHTLHALASGHASHGGHDDDRDQDAKHDQHGHQFDDREAAVRSTAAAMTGTIVR